MAYQSDFIQISGGPVTYYTEHTATNLYVEKSFGRTLTRITITNDSTTDPVQFSFDGATLDGELKGNESITVHLGGKSSVFIKATTGGGKVRIWGS